MPGPGALLRAYLSCDLLLNYTHTGDRRTPVSSGDPSGAASEPNGAMSIFEAVTRQLGLKLEIRNRMVPVLVIDHIEEKPTDN